jgi:DNA segregation ATPase FtsK/SpoIIIE-like protein
VEEEHPTRRDDRGCDERDDAIRETCDEHGDQRDARDREQGRDESQLDEPAAGVRDQPREQKMKWCAAALAENRADELSDRAATREERERLVLVWGPDGQAGEEKRCDRRRECADADAPERVRRGCDGQRTPARGRRRGGVVHRGIIGKRPGTLLA